MSSIPTFETLFGESAHGKRKMWSVTVLSGEGTAGIIRTTHGYEDGKKVVNDRVVETGKNIGKSNETTPIQQAVSEAKALWKKKCDAGYRPEEAASPAVPAADDDASSVGAAGAADAVGIAVPLAVPLPMLAQDFNKRGKSIVYPCLIQAKLDGVRCVAVTGKGLFSRNGKAFPHLDHIRAEINHLPAGTILDGELYSDALTFQEIVGLVKKETLKAGDTEKMAKIYLSVYDVMVTDKTNAERNEMLEGLLDADAGPGFQHLRLLPSKKCMTKEEVKAFHADYVAAGYEGLMLRNIAGKYRVGVRSTDLQKYKEFEDAEYRVVGFKEGDGLEKGCVVWVCETTNTKGIIQNFAVRPRGTHEERAALFKEAAKYVGKSLCVRYQELTTDGIPRFPVGIAFRDYE